MPALPNYPKSSTVLAMNSNTPISVLGPENTICNLASGSKKNLFEIVAKHIAKQTHNITWEEIFNALIAREKYGTTGFGNGIAIPHCRLKSCKKAIGVFVKLKTPIDFDALDHEPVDLVFVLIVPEKAHDEHLNLLAQIAGVLDKNPYRISLRDCHDHLDLFKRFEKMLLSTPCN